MKYFTMDDMLLSEPNKCIAVNPANRRPGGEKGFTIVELMIALVLTFIVTAGLYRTYVSFQVTFDAQSQLVEMQQNLRIGMNRLVSDMKMAGYDPRQTGQAGFKNEGSKVTSSTTANFKMDLFGGNEDGVDNDTDGITDEADETSYGDSDFDDKGEHIYYYLAEDSLGSQNLYRDDLTDSSPADPIVQNVEVLEFVYVDLDFPDAKIAEVDGMIPDAELPNIGAVEISLIIRTTNEDFSYTDNTSYKNLRDEEILAPQGDHYRRKLLRAKIILRNNS
jgi:type IV pilus assembly protein PilW